MELTEAESDRFADEQLLKNRGWSEKHGLWTNPEKMYQGKLYIFSFEDACKIERILNGKFK